MPKIGKVDHKFLNGFKDAVEQIRVVPRVGFFAIEFLDCRGMILEGLIPYSTFEDAMLDAAAYKKAIDGNVTLH